MIHTVFKGRINLVNLRTEPIMKTLRQHQQEFYTRLRNHYPGTELQVLFFMLCEHLLDKSRLHILQMMDEPVNESFENHFIEFIHRLSTQEPVQYILGKAWFSGIEFTVNPHVLIPRPETEELVDWILKTENDPVHLLDIGTGSGCIALALAHYRPGFTILGLDVSEDALAIAKGNATSLNLNVGFIQADILQQPVIASEPQFDVIVSNPPYVMESEQALMASRVLEYEPGTALFVPDADPLKFYTAILGFSKDHLKTGGRIYFEINEQLGDSMVQLLTGKGYTQVEIKKDIHEKHRFVRGVKSR